jgi:hypothetical protein
MPRQCKRHIGYTFQVTVVIDTLKNTEYFFIHSTVNTCLQVTL